MSTLVAISIVCETFFGRGILLDLRLFSLKYIKSHGCVTNSPHALLCVSQKHDPTEVLKILGVSGAPLTFAGIATASDGQSGWQTVHR